MSIPMCSLCGHISHGVPGSPCQRCPEGGCRPPRRSRTRQDDADAAYLAKASVFLGTPYTEPMPRKRGVPPALTMSNSVEHGTPEIVFDRLDRLFGPFNLDVASGLTYHTSDVILARPGGKIITLDGSYEGTESGGVAHDPEENNGLVVPWTGRAFMNHPYGADDWKWVRRAHHSVWKWRTAEIVVAVIPVKTQMYWYHRYVHSGFVNGWAYGTTRGAARVRHAGAQLLANFLGRARFGGMETSAPFNTAIAVWSRTGIDEATRDSIEALIWDARKRGLG